MVHPRYQNQGIGSLLVKWGLDQASKSGAPVWLEATPQGRRLYEKHGFELVDELFVPAPDSRDREGASVSVPLLRWVP